ncbi:DUF1565 domain-containing protein [Halobellus ordinarius]|uniref:DUF1565 domain-containing protein n=1 Tax=Halobellus ordinarius TaxID=3075120 RepID=UPI0028805C83|nr:DUF1565 domain-containing protein [Halobellus sp. ZY16]
MKRRAFLASGVAGVGLLAGCSGESGSDQQTASDTTVGTRTDSATATTSQTPRESPTTIFVAPDGSDNAPGTREEPLKTIPGALIRAQPGETVHALPGRYKRPVETVRSGTADEPITVTGPPDAIFNADGPFEINHDHVHIQGLTFDGLHTPTAPEDPDSYAESLLQVNERFYETIKNGERGDDPVPDDKYLTGVKVKPHAVGNCRADFIKVHWSKNIEIGEFRIIGPAGVKFLKGDATGHNSEIIYLGNAPSKGYPPDQTRNIHIHHIDNSEGYVHSELVDCKTGTSNVTIEYCTGAGGSAEAITDEGTESALHIGGSDITVRWNILSGGAEAGIEIDSDIAATENPPESYAAGGTNNAIYGNRLLNNDGLALRFAYPDTQGQDAQRIICGNEYNGQTHGEPDRSCPNEIPAGDGVGHTGGESPWT